MADEKWLDDLKKDIIVIKETLKNMVATNDLKLIAMDEKLKVMSEGLKSLENNRLEVISLKNKLESAETRIKNLEDNNKWLWRTVAGAVIVAVMGFVLKK